MYCVNGKTRSSLFIESTDSMIYKNENTFKNEQRNRDDAAKKRDNTRGVEESNNYYEDIYNIPPYNNTH